ncbi:MAG: acetate kinase [Candidatus Latescibacteria bacterium 4484_181]|nr:MAG: acetate kinase [Candidatus Latescibacteria bacterium 4484_181]RKY68992.1 MAG: acetate kinase [Candidatus Latescibacterota bacterium]RKY73255.1 MAG: acetate kinase [Candidatus Latescibacterota bacterium]HDN67921.1 acetate kinase [Bacillota bacterium]
MKILVINSGSSSIKYQLFSMPQEKILARGLLERIGLSCSVLHHSREGNSELEISKQIRNHHQGLKVVLEVLSHPEYGAVEDIDEIDAVGHRVVHGGEKYTASCLVDDDLVSTVREFCELAPLHNPHNLAGIEACQKLLPSVPQVAVFDTAFHQSIADHAYLYAIPYLYYEKYRVRRYGFHGTSHRYVALRAAQILGQPLTDLRVITCHLGNGCSITAVKGGKSVETSMGFTPLEGLVMGTRSGDLDPAVAFYLMEKLGLSASQMKQILNKKSGLLGVSEVSNDMRDIWKAKEAGNPRADLSLRIFWHRLKKYIGAYAAVMNGLDALIFTAGIGENDCQTREKVCQGMDYLGIEIDKDRNAAIQGEEAVISTDSSRVKVLVVPTNEELMIAQDTYQIAKGKTEGQ